MRAEAVERVGFATGYDASLSVADMVPWVRRAEEAGFELGFFSETISLMRDSVTAVSAFASATERIGLGYTQIVRLRSPVVMAQTLASLDELSGGRAVIALGACTRSHAQRHGLPHLDPETTLRDWAASMRMLLGGGEVTYAGRSVSLEQVSFGWRPPRQHVPFWIAATSPKGLRLAGEIGDGVLLNSVASPAYSANAIAIVREAAENAGRDWEEFEVAQIVNCSIEDSRDRAIDAIRWEVASKFDPVQMPFNARPRIAVGEPHIDEDDLPRFVEAYREGGKTRLMAVLPESYIEGLTAAGTEEDVVAKVGEYRRAGVTLPVLRPAASHQTERVLELFGG